MKNWIIILGLLGFVGVLFADPLKNNLFATNQKQQTPRNDYWFILHRTSNKEELYQGAPGEKDKSKLIKTFKVKTGVPGERPTPLPKLLGRKYWVITEKHPEPDNPETAPYFITLDVPAPTGSPYGPEPYMECNGQCDWVKPGDFGLHGIGGNPEKLSENDPGSSGCIRHTDDDISYLYNLLDTTKSEIRYYIEVN